VAGVILAALAFYWFLASGTMAQVVTSIVVAMHPFTVTPAPS